MGSFSYERASGITNHPTADEMGLGKTLQTIAFSAYLREHQNFKPFLVVCPLSVLHNWVDEYKKFAPDVRLFSKNSVLSEPLADVQLQIPVCMYHGTPVDRAELRRTVMARPGAMRARSGQNKASSKGKAKRKPGRPTKSKPREEVEDDGKTLRRSGRPRKSTVIIESDDDEEMQVDDEAKEAKTSGEYTAKFPIVLTTYDMIIRDRTHLAHYDWGYIVVDEGHRLKNLNCKLMKEIKKYSSAGRMILTGTPLHVSLRIFIRCSWSNALPRIISPSYGRCLISFFLTSSAISTLSKTGS